MSIDYEMLLSNAENGDPFAMCELANLYDMGAIPDSSESMFVYWYKRFWETPEVKAFLYNLDSEDDNDESIDPFTEMALRGYVIEAGLALGLYYMNSTDIDEAKLALECIQYAWVASAFDYLDAEELDGKSDIFQLLRQQQDWIDELEGRPK